MKTYKRLYDAYRFPGFIPRVMLKGLFGDSHARIIQLQRREEKRSVAHVDGFPAPTTTEKRGWSGTSHAVTCGYTLKWKSGGLIAGAAEA